MLLEQIMVLWCLGLPHPILAPGRLRMVLLLAVPVRGVTAKMFGRPMWSKLQVCPSVVCAYLLTSRLQGSAFVMYYSAQVSDGSTHCVGVATASSPGGPYEPQGSSPLACPTSQGGAIDANGFQDADGTNYLLYKVDGNSIGNGGDCNNSNPPIQPTPIMLQRMSADGTATDGSAAVQILDRSDADGPLVEAPSLVRVQDSSSSGGWLYILFFSSNCYSSSLYDVSYAYSTSGVGGPYTKAGAPVAPLLQTSTPYSQLYAPGGLSITSTGTNVVFMADEGQTSDTRQMYTGSLSFDIEGRSVSI